MPEDVISSPTCLTYGDSVGRTFDVGEVSMGLFSDAKKHLEQLETALSGADPVTEAHGVVFHVEQYHPDEDWDHDHADIDALFAWYEHSGIRTMAVDDVIGGFVHEGHFSCP